MDAGLVFPEIVEDIDIPVCMYDDGSDEEIDQHLLLALILRNRSPAFGEQELDVLDVHHGVLAFFLVQRMLEFRPACHQFVVARLDVGGIKTCLDGLHEVIHLP